MTTTKSIPTGRRNAMLVNISDFKKKKEELVDKKREIDEQIKALEIVEKLYSAEKNNTVDTFKPKYKGMSCPNVK